MTSDHTVTIILDDTDELSGAVRGDSKLGQHLYNYRKNTPTRTGNGASVIVKGDYTSTGIHGFPEVVIEDGGILREHLASGETLFDGVETVTIQEGGALDLLQSNEISGNLHLCRHIENACADQRRSRYLLFDGGRQCHRAGGRGLCPH